MVTEHNSTQFAGFVQAGTPADGDHPNGSVAVGDLWIDTSGAGELKRCSSLGPIVFTSTESPAAAHDILSASHGDALAAAVSRGSIILGNSTPAWAELVIGAADRVLKSDGTDGAWGQVGHDELTDVAADDHHNESHTVASHSDTSGTGTELDTLTDKSNADSLHNHGEGMKLTVSVESPTTADDIKISFFDVAVTITKIVITIVGSSTPSWTVDLRHHTDRSNAGNAVITTPTASTEAANNAESTGHIISSFDDATIPLDSYLWLETDAVGGTVTIGSVTVFYTVD